MAPMRSPFTPSSRRAIATNASCQLTGCNLPCTRSHGRSRRRRRRPSNENRPLSDIHSSFTSSLVRGWMLSTSAPRAQARMLVPVASSTSIVSVRFSSHGRAVKALGLEVSAPTGQMSIRLPDSSDVSAFST